MEKTFTIERKEIHLSTYQVTAPNLEEALRKIEEDGEFYLLETEESETGEAVVKSVEESPYVEKILNYMGVEEEVDEDAPANTPLEKFEKAIGWRLNKSIVQEFPFQKLPTNAQLRSFYADFCRERLKALGEVIEIETSEYREPKNVWCEGRFLAEIEGLELYHRGNNREEYGKVAVNSFNTYRFESADDAVIALFERLTGLSHYWVHQHVILAENGAPSKHFKYNWNEARFEEHPLVRFERIEGHKHGEYKLA